MSERAPREGLLLPILIPLASLVVIGVVLIGFSRILLNTTHAVATIVALLAALGVMGLAAWVAKRPAGSTASLLSLAGGAAGIAMLAGGVALVAAPPHGEEGGGVPVVAIVAPPGAAADGYAEDRVTAPAGVAFEIAFDNQDPGVPHNVFIATEEGGENLFEGATINGPATTTYSVDPLEEGSYFFFCSIHPTTMTGTLEAVPGATGGEGGGQGPTVVAQELAFEPTEIELPADQPTTITFENRDDVGSFGQHNIAIYQDDTFATALWTGELVSGPATVTYEVEPLPAGTYAFRCDVHPQMTGTVRVDGGGGGDGGGDGAAEEPGGG
ncbi:MAG: hypothetical protein KatS3mg013_1146 [Actinomycetota bacterium]|jgi:plastocyanin|nr:MAG: hypothetical protein KatS3mg013_1146 [Actinomycetota bacterium]